MDRANQHDATTIACSRRPWAVVLVLTIATLTLIAFRFHAFDLPLETDEGNYAYIAARLLDGDRLYVDVWDHQPPGVFILFAGAIALFGDAPVVFRLMACAFSITSMLLIFGIVRRLLHATFLCSKPPTSARAGSPDRTPAQTVDNRDPPNESAASRFPRSSPSPEPQASACATLAEDKRPASSRIGLAGCGLALVAAFLFAIVSSDPGTAGEGCQREIYMNTLILGAWYLALRSAAAARAPSAPTQHTDVARDRRVAMRYLALAGSSLALASLIKTVVVVHWLALAVWVLMVSARSVAVRPRGLKPAARDSDRGNVLGLLAFAAGPLLVWGVTFLYFAATDRFAEFFDAVFTFNLGYSGDKSWLARVVGFFRPDRQPFIFDSALPLWIAGAIAGIALTIHLAVKRDMRSLSVLLLIAASFVAVCLPGRSWPHYYYLMIPPLVICVCYTIGVLARMPGAVHAALISTRPVKHGHASVDHATHTSRERGFRRCALPVTLIGIVVSGTIYTQYRDYLSQPSFGITVKRYNSRDFWGRGQGENVRRATDPSDTVFVYGHEASIYYYAQRRCASRYTMITGLADGMPGAEDRRATLMEELRASPPRLILVLFDEQPFDAWTAFLHEHYGEPIGWDRHDKNRGPIMFVLARKEAPVKPIDWDWDRSSVGGWQLDAARR